MANLSTRVSLVEQSVEFIRKDISDIKTNHMAHMQKSLEEMSADIAQLRQTDKKGEWLETLGGKIVEAIIMSLVVGVLLLLGLKIR